MDGKELTYDDAVEEIAKRYGVPKSVYSRMVGQESGGDDAAISPKGATSRWQIMPGTARGLGIDPSDPLQAAEGGLRLLRDNYKRFRKQAKNEKHAWMMAVAGYHGNPANVEKDLKAGGYGLPMISDGSITTRDHVLKIFDGITSDTLDRNPFGTATAVKPVNPLAPRSFGQPSDVPVPEVKIEAGQPQPMQMATPENVAKLGLQFATPENMKALTQPTPQAAPEEKGGAIVTPTVQGQKPLVQPPDLNAPIQTPVNTPPVPETADTLVAQRDAAHDPRSTRIGVLFPKGTPVPPVNKDETLVKLPDGGAIITNTKKLQGYLRQNRIMRAQIERGKVDYTPLLGGKADVTTNTANKPAVVTRDARTGKELVASTVERPESVPVETQLQQAQFPGRPTTTELTDSDVVTAERLADGTATDDGRIMDEPDPQGIAGELRYSPMPQGQDPVKWAMDDIAQGLETKFQIPFRVGRAFIEKYGIGTDPREGSVRNMSRDEVAASVRDQKAFIITNRDLDELLRLASIDQIFQGGRDKGLPPSEAYRGLLGQGLIPDEEVARIADTEAAKEAELRQELQAAEQAKIVSTMKASSIATPDGKVFRTLDTDLASGNITDQRDIDAINKAADEQFKKILMQYGNVDSYRMSQQLAQGQLRAQKEHRDWMYENSVPQYTIPLQVLSNIGQSAVEVATDLIAAQDVVNWALGIPSFTDMLATLQTGTVKNSPAYERAGYQLSQGFQKWFKDNSYDDKLLHTDMLASALLNEVPRVLTQVTTQAIAGAATGGAALPTVMGSSQGLMERYREAVEGGATPEQLRLVVATAAMLAVPEFVSNRLILGPVMKTAGGRNLVDSLFNRSAKQVFTKFVDEVGEVEARQLTKATLTGLAAKFADMKLITLDLVKRGVKNAPELLKAGGFEAIQEVWLEDKINNAVAYYTHDKSQTRWNQVQFLTQQDLLTMGVSALAGAGGNLFAVAASRVGRPSAKIEIDGKEYEVGAAEKPLLRQALVQYDTALETWEQSKQLFDESRKQKTGAERALWRQAAANAYQRGVLEFESAEEMYRQVQEIVAGRGAASGTPLEKVMFDDVYGPVQMTDAEPIVEQPAVAEQQTQEIPAQPQQTQELTIEEIGQGPGQVPVGQVNLKPAAPAQPAETGEDASITPVTDETTGVTTGPVSTPTTGGGEGTRKPGIPVAGVKPTQTPVVQGIQIGKPATDAAHDAATSPENDLPEPTQAQKEAGNYQKGHIKVNGLDIAIENPVGSERSGHDKDGKAWSVTMNHHYGYIKRTVGADEEQIDTFVKDGTPDNFNGNVYVVDQIDPATGKFDEHKVMLGYETEAKARKAYLSNYAKGWKGLGEITAMPFDFFKTWATGGAATVPVADIIDAEGSPKVMHDRAGFRRMNPTMFRQADMAKTVDEFIDAVVKAGKTTRDKVSIPDLTEFYERVKGTWQEPEQADKGAAETPAEEPVDEQTTETAETPVDIPDEQAADDEVDFDELFGQAASKKYSKPEETADEEGAKATHTLEGGGTVDLERDSDKLTITTGDDSVTIDVGKLPRGMRFTDLSEQGQQTIRKVLDIRSLDPRHVIFAVDDKNKVAFAYNIGIDTAANRYLISYPTQGTRLEDTHGTLAELIGKREAMLPKKETTGGTSTGGGKTTGTPKTTTSNAQDDAIANLASVFGFELPQAEPGPVLEDFGEKIGGARKDLWAQRGLTFADLAGLSERERQKLVTKDQIWPRPDYEAIYQNFIANGLPPEDAAGEAYLVKMVYDDIVQPPIKEWEQRSRRMDATRDELWEKYIAFVENARDTMGKVLAALPNKEWSIEWQTRITKTDGTWKSVDTTFTKSRRSYRSYYDSPQYHSSRAYRKAKETGFPATREMWTRHFELTPASEIKIVPHHWTKWQDGTKYTEYAVYAGSNQIGKFDDEKAAETFVATIKDAFILYGYRHKWDGQSWRGFTTKEAAQKAARELYAAMKVKPTGEPTRPMLKGIERTGEDFLKGKPATPEKFTETFGFRGIEFGNWLTQEDRRQSLKHAYNALMDLANVLGVNPKALSLNGKLGLAFGSRGRKGAAAHYEPSRLAINLTKLSGAGSLAHEWAHALDDYFGSLAAGANYATDAHKGYASQSSRYGLRHEMQTAWGNVVNRILKREAAQESTIAEARASQKNTRKNTLAWMQSLYSPIKETDQFKEAYAQLEKQLEREDIRGVDAMTDFTQSLAQLYRPKRRKIFEERTYWLNRTDRDLDRAIAGELVKSVDTDYITHAKNLDQLFKSKPYWSTVLELFARAFESYIEDKTNSKSQYLVHGTKGEPQEYETKHGTKLTAHPYPISAEREAINDAFDTFFQTIEQETDEETGNVSLKAIEEDDQRYEQAIKPALADAFKAFEAETPIEAMQGLLDALEAKGLNEDQIRQMKPYIVRFFKEEFTIKKPDEKADEGDIIEEQDNDTADTDISDRDGETSDEGEGPADVRPPQEDEATGEDSDETSGSGPVDLSPDEAASDESDSNVDGAGTGKNTGGVSGGKGGKGNGTGSGGGVSRTRNRGNYLAESGTLTREGSWVTAAKNNLDAIELVKQIEAEGRKATPEEQAVLVKFVGWGASELANNVFQDPNGYRIKPEWKDVATRLREVLTEDEIATAQRSTQYAHYTSEKIIRGIWSAIEQFGFANGTILEPGMGIGLFPIAAPETLIEKSGYTGIEMDAMTARIAKLLLPDQTVLEEDYTKRRMPKDFFDVAIGNPPFANIKIQADQAYRKHGFLLHDYFFAKTIDSVRPGGLMAFVTSKGTMDKRDSKARAYMAERADLLGAIRLPQTAFKQNAGTEVVTDVLFFRKRKAGEEPGGEKWLDLGEITAKNEDGENTTGLINEYFLAHPEMVLGLHAFTGSQYRANEYTVTPHDGDIEEQFQDAVKNLPTGVYAVEDKKGDLANDIAERDWDPKVKKEGSLYIHDDGRLMIREGGSGVPVQNVNKKQHKWLKDYVGLRDALKQAQYDQLHAEDEGYEGDWEKSLAALNKVYDAFVKKHGKILDYTTRETVVKDKTTKKPIVDEDGNPVMQVSRNFKNDKLLANDIEGPLVWTLEKITDEGDIIKSNWLKERQIKPPEPPKIETLNDALMVSLDRIGALNIPHVVETIRPVREMTEEEVIEELGELIYEQPGGGWVMADEYLSGNVKAKLEIAEAAASDPRFRRNVEALLKVQPLPMPAEKITVQAGAPWVPVEVVAQFATEMMGIKGKREGDRYTGTVRPAVEYDSITGKWTVPQAHGSGSQQLRDAASEWGTVDRSPAEVLEAALNSESVTITKTDYDSKPPRKYTDKDGMAAVQAKIEKVIDAFSTWIFADEKRATEMVDLYNDKMNVYADREFNGEHLTTPGLSFRYKLFPHQKRAIWRIIQTGNTYLAHAVGAGKTLEMIVSAMEQKRLGKIRKPMFIVPNHMLKQFASEFLDAYPLANIMVADEQNFHTDNRRRFVAQAALNDLDAVILTHSSFGLLRATDESARAVLDDMIAELQEQMEALTTGEDKNGNPIGDTLQDTSTIKRIQAQIERIEQRFYGRMGKERDNVLDFEELGVDFLYVDEAHEFRKLDFATSQTNLKGIDPNGSLRALDLLVKARWLDRQRPGRSLVMASGTAITNTMAELYTVQRFMDHRALIDDGLDTFDGWAKQFGKVEERIEANAAGGYKPVKRFRRIVNTGVLMQRVRLFMDVLTTPQLADLIRVPKIKPNSKGVAAAEVIITEHYPELEDYLHGTLKARIKASEEWKPSFEEKFNPDPMIAIIGDGQLAAFDMRFINPSLPSNPNSKLNRMIDGIIDSYNKYNDLEYSNPLTGEPYPIKGAAHIVFSYGGFGDQVALNRGFNAREWMRKRLIESGIPASEIAFISDYKSSSAKEALFKEIREGKKKILVGSPKNMGTGVNAQLRLKTLHYGMAPWYPADIEQPHGRIVRQGNQNDEVELYWYAAKGTYDETQWGMLAGKGTMIEDAFSGNYDGDIEDVSESSQYAMASALASGDPRALKFAELRGLVEKYNRLEQSYYSGRTQMHGELRTLDSDWGGIGRIENDLATLDQVIDEAPKEKVNKETFTIKIGDQTFDKNSKETTSEIGNLLKGAWIKGVAALSPAVIDKKKSQRMTIATVMGKYPIEIEVDEYGGMRSWARVRFNEKYAVKLNDTAAFANTIPELSESGLIQRIHNAFNGLADEKRRGIDKLNDAKARKAEIEAALAKPFEFEDELAKARAEMNQLALELANAGIEQPPQEIEYTEEYLEIVARQNEVANNYELWQEQYDPYNEVTEEEFNEMSVVEKIRPLRPPVSLKAIEGDTRPQEVVTLGEHSVPVFRNRNLDENGETVQDATLKRLKENTGFLVGAYIKKNPKIVNADLAKELFKQFRDDPAANDLAVHAAASALARLVFTQRLAELPKGSIVLLTAGGNATGKSSTIDVRHADLVYDSTMSQKDGNRKMIDQVAESGHHGIIDVIYRKPADATRAMMYRYHDTRRPVTERSMAWTHHNVPKAFVEDTDAYARELGLEVNYWETVSGKALTELTLDEYKEKAYSEYAGVLDAIRTVIDEELATGKYDDRSESILRPQPRGDKPAAQGRNEADEGNAASRADGQAEGPESLKHIEPSGSPIFYSGLERMLVEKMPERASAAQVRGIIKDARVEEREWTGIDEWLDGQTGAVAKADVLEFVRGNNLQLVEREVESRFPELQTDGERTNERDLFLTAPHIDAKWSDGHGEYDDIDNPVVRLRVSDRPNDEGGKDLMVDEFQPPKPEEFEKMPEAIRANVYKLAVKYALRIAAEGGYDNVLWTMGEQQQGRSNLASGVSELQYRKAGVNGDKFSVRAFDSAGRPVVDQVSDTADLERQFGKTVADKIVEHATERPQLLNSDELESGKGLPTLYDTYIRHLFNRIGRRFKIKADTKTLGDTQVHRFTVDPAMAMQPLFRAEEESEEDFRNVKFQAVDELARRATVTRTRDRVKINLEAQEFMRRVAEEIDIRSGKKKIGDPNYEASFSGQFYEPAKVQQTIKTLRDIAALATKENVPAVATFSNQLADEIEAAAAEGKGTLIAFMWDRRLPHEIFHQASYLGDLTRSLTRRHANPLALDKHPAVKKAWDNHFSKFAEYRAQPDGLRQAVIREETAAWIAGGEFETLGLTAEEAAEYLIKWFDSYTEKNGVNALDKFEEVEGQTYEIVQSIKEAYRQAASEGSGDGQSGETVSGGQGQEPPGAGPVDGGSSGSGSEGPQGGRQRLRSLPATMREAGLDAIDELYDVVGHDAASQRAAAILQEKGLAGAVEYLDGQKQRDGVDGRLEFLISRALQNLVNEKRDTNPAEAAALDEFRREWNREIAKRRTEAGQYTESAKQADLPVANVVVTAEEMLKAKHGKDATLTPEDRLKFEDMQRDLDQMLDDLAAERRKLRNEKARSKRLQDRLDGKTKRRTRSSQMARSHLVEVIREKHAKDLKADIRDLQAEFRAAVELVPVKAVQGDRRVLLPVEYAMRDNPHTRTAAFKKWFAGSVVTFKGEPRVMYHGTFGDFDSFRPSETGILGAGIYSTSEPNEAEEYANGAGGNVIPVYAAIKNPIGQKELDRIIERYDHLDEESPEYGESVQADIQAAGYDGVYVRSELGEMLAVVFNPSQIKSAIGNRGTFDPNDPNILKAVESDTAPLAPETLEKLARVGAMTLIEGIAGSEDVYLPEQFRAQMTAMFGEGVKPHLDTIYHESMRTRAKWLAEAAWDRRTKGIKNTAQSDEGRAALEKELGRALEDEELSDADVYRILDIRRDVQRKRNAIERMHRLASGYKPSNVTNELSQTIIEVAPDENVAAAAMIFADGATKDQFYERAKALGLATDKKALRKLFVAAQEALKAAKAAIKLNHDEAVKEVAQASELIETIQDAIWKARLDAHEKQKDIADELEKLQSPVKYYAGKIYTVPMDLFNDLQATLEWSFILRQYGRNLTSEPIRTGVNSIISLATGTPYDWKADLKEQGSLWAAAWNAFKSGKSFGRVVQAVEHDTLFTEALSLGLKFSVAGKIGSGHQAGEEQLSSGAIDAVANADWKNMNPVAKVATAVPVGYARGVARFDDTMAAMGDSLRMMMYRRMATALRNEGMKPETHPNEYKEIIKDINRSTGKANKFENVPVAQHAMDALVKSRLMRAANYTVSNWQKIGADTKNVTLAIKNLVTFQGLPKGAQKQMLARALYSYAALGLNLAIQAAILGAVVSFDPDDDDFLKFKWGKYRYDVSFGLRTELKQIFRYAAMIQRGSRVPYEMLYDTVNYSTRYGRSKLGALPGFIVDTLITGKDFKGDPVSVADWKVWVKLITPMTYMNAIETMSEHGVGATMRTMPVEMFGGGTSVYDDRIEEAKTPAEKLALKIKRMKQPWFSPTEYADRIDKDTWKKVSELKARSRAGEDVKAELDALENDGKINPRIIKDVLDARHKSILVEFMEDARLAPNERAAIEKAASPEEKQQIKEARGTLLKRMERASTDEAIKIYDEAEKRLDDAQRKQFLKMIEAKARYANDYGTLTQDERDRLARILPDLKIQPKAPKMPKPPKPSKAPALEGVY